MQTLELRVDNLQRFGKRTGSSLEPKRRCLVCKKSNGITGVNALFG